MEEGEYKMRGKKVMVVSLCVLLLLGALAFVSLSLGQQKALADEATFNTTASDGYLIGANVSSYSNAHNAPIAFSWDSDTSNRLPIGQTGQTGFNIFRSALYFDTSSLPDSAIIISANLSLYGYQDSSQTDFDLIVVDGSLLNDPIEGGDYGYLLNQTTSGGVFNTSGFSTGSYNDIPLNSAGIGWISKTGMTQFGLRSSRDILAIVPGAFSEEIEVSSYEGGGNISKLVVSYFTAPPTLTITPTPTVTPTIPPTPTDVPTLSQWGMIGMAIVLAAFLVWSIRRRWVVRTGKS